MTPTSPMASVTESPAALIMAAASACIGPVASGAGACHITSRTPAVANATSTMAKKMAFTRAR